MIPRHEQIVIVGGGPVGLWTAIQLKKRNAAISVIIHERYNEYRRSHVINLKQLSLLLYARQNKSQDEGDFYQQLISQARPSLQGSLKSFYIRTRDLETALKDYAQRLGVVIVYQEIADVAALPKLYPACRIFIGADGAHSRVRQEICGASLMFKHDLQHVCELKYEAAGSTQPLQFLTDHYRTLKVMPYLFFEHVGKQRNDLTPITTRFFVTPAIYDAIGEASFKNPVLVDAKSGNLPKPLFDAINMYLSIRKETLRTEPVHASLKVTKLTLSIYAAQRSARLVNETGWFLVGDALLGVPYFRSLNAGLICGSRLAQILAKNTVQSTVKKYGVYFYVRLTIEYLMAFSKNACLNLYGCYIRISALVPWQVNKWTTDQLRVHGMNLYVADKEEE